MRYFFFLKLFLFTIVFFLGCGRKPKYFYDFTPPQKIKINKLNLPAIKGLKAQKSDKGVLLSWHSIDSTQLGKKIDAYTLIFLGYNVYRFASSGFVSRKALNKFIITENQFLDEIKFEKLSYCYLVRAVFKISPSILRLFDFTQDSGQVTQDARLVEGPASQVICTDDKKFPPT